MKYEFSENNSGGSWWLDRAQYERLMANGWQYEASDFDKEQGFHTTPFLADEGDNVPWGWRNHLTGEFDTIQAAVESFERHTGEDFFAEGCNCCGCPFSIHASEGSEYVSGDSVARQTIRPW